MSQQVCVDASVVIKLFLPEEGSERAQRLVGACQQQGMELVAPSLMPYEVVSTFHKHVSERNLSLEQCQEVLALFMTRRFALFLPDALHELACAVATRCGQTVLYDAYYLALAELLDCDYWTADLRFHRAAAPHFSRIRLLSEYAG